MLIDFWLRWKIENIWIKFYYIVENFLSNGFVKIICLNVKVKWLIL